jgi:hypothetical protein
MVSLAALKQSLAPAVISQNTTSSRVVSLASLKRAAQAASWPSKATTAATVQKTPVKPFSLTKAKKSKLQAYSQIIGTNVSIAPASAPANSAPTAAPSREVSLVKLKQPAASAAVVAAATPSTAALHTAAATGVANIAPAFSPAPTAAGLNYKFTYSFPGTQKKLLLVAKAQEAFTVSPAHKSMLSTVSNISAQLVPVIFCTADAGNTLFLTNSSGTCSLNCPDRYLHNNTANINIVRLFIRKEHSSSHICNQLLMMNPTVVNNHNKKNRQQEYKLIKRPYSIDHNSVKNIFCASEDTTGKLSLSASI